MGIFVSGRGTIPQIDQVVKVNGLWDPRIECVSIRYGSGAGSTSASFRIPALLCDSVRGNLTNGLVTVYLDGRSVFTGILDTDNARLSTSEDGVTFEARSITSWLTAAAVGAVLGRFEVQYVFQDAKTRVPTGLTPLKVLEDLFTRLLPAEYQSYIRLGDTAILAREAVPLPPDLTFRGQHFAGAIDQILALYGDVTYTERFDSEVCSLDFYRINSGQNGVISVRVAQWDSADLANVASIERNLSSVETRNRIIGYGDFRKFAVSLKNYVAALPAQSQSDTKKRLVPKWNATYEPAVLDNPNAAKPGSLGYSVQSLGAHSAAGTVLAVKTGIDIWAGAILSNSATGERMQVTAFTPETAELNAQVTVTRGYGSTTPDDIAEKQELIWEMPGVEWVFRRYGLPACFKDLKTLRDLPWLKSTGEAIPAQAWRYETSLAPAADPTSADWIGTVNTYPTHLPGGCTFELDRNQVVFSEPQLNVVKISADPNPDNKSGIKIERQQAVVGITIGYQLDSRFFHDTGAQAAGPGLPFQRAGLMEQFPRDDLQYWQRGNANYPLTDPSTGASVEMGCVWFDEEAADSARAQTVASGSYQIVRDDLPTLRAVVLQKLRERNRPHVSYTVGIPYWSPAFQVGRQLDVSGLALEDTNLVVTQVEVECGPNHRTRLTVDNCKPPRRLNVGGKL